MNASPLHFEASKKKVSVRHVQGTNQRTHFVSCYLVVGAPVVALRKDETSLNGNRKLSRSDFYFYPLDVESIYLKILS